VKPETLGLLDELATDPRVSVMRRPGPFNYAALCNDGAAATRAPLLLFLNSDIDVIGPDWLRHLADLAVRPDVGAVGAKLLYPDDRLQHAGVTVGLNGFAGHLYSGAGRDEPGHLGELRFPHEVSAVTGACVAVERHKFEAVGGYDAQNLPVDLNDVDLCLRLGEQGWRTIWTPDAELYHLESASRGRAIRGSKVYSRERTYFRERWAHVIRDDPYYHPALSLVARNPVLG
jgi:GT2 family glycosyltransferase